MVVRPSAGVRVLTRPVVRFAALCAALALGAPGTAAAQSDGVFNDDILPRARVDQSYAASVRGSDAIGYSFRVVSGALPPGLSMSEAGPISGVPTEVGTFDFRVAATALAGGAQRDYQILVWPRRQLVIATANLPTGVEGLSYVFDLVAVSGVAPYTWTLVEGPDWLSLSRAGRLEAVPPEPGLFPLIVEVAAGDEVASRELLLPVASTEPLEIVVPDLPNAVLGENYCARPVPIRLTARGGLQPYRWFTEGDEDFGRFFVRPNGVLCGRPIEPGVRRSVIRVLDALNGSDTAEIAIRVVADPLNPGLRIVTAFLPRATVGRPYDARLMAVTDTPPVSWRLSEGRLPGGLALDDDRITGVPTDAGTFIFEVEAEDAFGTAQQALSLEVGPEPIELPPGPTGPTGPTGFESADGVGCRCVAPRPGAGRRLLSFAVVALAMLLLAGPRPRRWLSKSARF